MSTTQAARVQKIEAGARDGEVVVVMDPDTARLVARWWGRIHANEPARGLARPEWPHEVVEIYEAAVMADLDRGIDPSQHPIPFELVLVEADR